jgi:hypothetical protein
MSAPHDDHKAELMGRAAVVEFPGVEAFNRRSKYRLEDFDTLQAGALTWRVKGLWPAVGVCFVGGPSMSGKSFWTLDALAKVCRGEDILGRKSVPSGVLYIAAEGAHGVKNRISGLRSRIGLLDGSFKFIGQAPDLRDPEDVADLRAVIGEAKAEMEARGETLGIVAVDTLSASIPGADENSAQDMSPVLHALQSMAADLGLVLVVIAHTGKDESRGLRGWSGLLANADGLIMLEDPKGEATRVGSVVKVKDGKSGDQFAFSLEVVSLGYDTDGDEITTCVIQPENTPERPKPGKKPNAAQTDADSILTAFNRIFPDKSAALKFPGADGAHGVHMDDLKAEAFNIGLDPPKPDLAGLDDAASKAALREWRKWREKKFERALDFLRAKGRHRIESGWFWEPRANGKSPT